MIHRFFPTAVGSLLLVANTAKKVVQQFVHLVGL